MPYRRRRASRSAARPRRADIGGPDRCDALSGVEVSSKLRRRCVSASTDRRLMPLAAAAAITSAARPGTRNCSGVEPGVVDDRDAAAAGQPGDERSTSAGAPARRCGAGRRGRARPRTCRRCWPAAPGPCRCCWWPSPGGCAAPGSAGRGAARGAPGVGANADEPAGQRPGVGVAAGEERGVRAAEAHRAPRSAAPSRRRCRRPARPASVSSTQARRSVVDHGQRTGRVDRRRSHASSRGRRRCEPG